MTVNPQQIVDEALESGVVDGEEEDDGPSLEDIGRDFELLAKRIQTKCRAAENGTKELTSVDVAHFCAEILTLGMEHLAHTKGQEDHAIWASEEITNLGAVLGDDEQASQLDLKDAVRFRAYFAGVHQLLDTLSESTGGDPGGTPWGEALKPLRHQTNELGALVEQIVLNPDDDPEDEEPPDGEAAAPPEAPEPTS